MKNIINVIIKAIIIIIAARFFPEYVVCEGTKTLILAITAIIISGIVIALVTCLVLIGLAAADHTNLAMVATIIMCVLSGIFQLMAAVKFVPGFEIHGILTYIILTVCMSLFSISGSKKE